MDQILGILLDAATEIVATLVIAAIGLFGTWLLSKISQNQNLKNIAEASAQVIATAQSTVLELQQTFVMDWKAAQNGKLTEEQIDELQNKLIEITMAKLAEPTLRLLEAAKIDVLTMIVSAAEERVYAMKSGE